MTVSSRSFSSLDPDSLNTIFLFAANNECSQINKVISLIWRSKHCDLSRNVTLKADFYRKLNLRVDTLPCYIDRSLTPANIRSQIDSKTLFLVQTALKENPRNVDLLYFTLNQIRTAEKKKAWLSSYLLAHVLAQAKISELIHCHDSRGQFRGVIPNLPFTSWLIFLRNPDNANHFCLTFNNNLASFFLDSEGTALCASSILLNYEISHSQSKQTITSHLGQIDLLNILIRLAKDNEGKKAVLNANGIERLQAIFSRYVQQQEETYLTYELSQVLKIQSLIQLLKEVTPSPSPRAAPSHSSSTISPPQSPVRSVDSCCNIT